MVTRHRFGVFLAVLLGAALGSLGAQTTSDGGSEASGPVLYGDVGGRVWKWSGGEKIWLTPEGRNLVLGGVGETELWGWALEGDQARFFSLPVPKKEAKKDDQEVEPTYEATLFPVPDRADKQGDRRLLVWHAHDQPRVEVWQGTELVTARAWDDGRSVYAAALGPREGWMVAGRTAEGLPWLEVVSGPVPAPTGWRGRLTVVAWVAEKDAEKDAPKAVGDAPKAPVPVHPWAAGWGAPGSEAAMALFWGPDGWTTPADQPAGATYPVLGQGGEALSLAGWQAESGTLRPWFWNGEEASVPGGAADGQPVAFSLGGKGGAFLVARHQSAPWYTLEDGKESVALEGLDAEDHVVAVEAAKASP